MLSIYDTRELEENNLRGSEKSATPIFCDISLTVDAFAVDGHVFITEDRHDVAIAVMSMWGQGGQLVDGGVGRARARCALLNSGYTPTAEKEAVEIVDVNAITETVT